MFIVLIVKGAATFLPTPHHFSMKRKEVLVIINIVLFNLLSLSSTGIQCSPSYVYLFSTSQMRGMRNNIDDIKDAKVVKLTNRITITVNTTIKYHNSHSTIDIGNCSLVELNCISCLTKIVFK